MSKIIINVAQKEYNLADFTINISNREVDVVSDNHETYSLLYRWFNEAKDFGKGVSPNYKKTVIISKGDQSYTLQGCWVQKLYFGNGGKLVYDTMENEDD
ncbi:hypothetical protein PCC7424_3217 [Gloeothece citriformis PCC 7424]|uniref:Uncharacterized protein n=1 Tax=Gloeothece citriformis (strain PCC 7424) TaxID=65393 RepID=B7KCR6_GLOC7|nr:hypothetical protein [Gloeothece citriformis]ACK71617.1 hypothetical protein PCC7424_3217 [Gloeothece citriformis PCC 7424]